MDREPAGVEWRASIQGARVEKKISGKENIGGLARLVALAVLLFFPLAASAAQVKRPAPPAPAPAAAPAKASWNLLDEARLWEGWGENSRQGLDEKNGLIPVERFLLKPEPRRASGERAAELASGSFEYGFTGRENDNESGLMHYRARSYDPMVGRFTSRDPVLNSNLYFYADNDPVNLTDPTGEYVVMDADDPYIEKYKEAFGEDNLSIVTMKTGRVAVAVTGLEESVARQKWIGYNGFSEGDTFAEELVREVLASEVAALDDIYTEFDITDVDPGHRNIARESPPPYVGSTSNMTPEQLYGAIRSAKDKSIREQAWEDLEWWLAERGVGPYNAEEKEALWDVADAAMAVFGRGKGGRSPKLGGTRGATVTPPPTPAEIVAANRAKSLARGIPESKLGPSGLPKRHEVNHASRKAAKDAARARVGKGGSAESHPTPKVGDPHFHGVEPEGEKVRIHDTYPKR